MKTGIHLLFYRKIRAPIIAVAACALASIAGGATPRPGESIGSDAALKQQIADLQAKVHQLEAGISSHAQQSGTSSGMTSVGGMEDMQGMQGAQQSMQGMEGMMGMMGQMMPGMMNQMMPGMSGMPPGNIGPPQSALPGFPGASHIYHIGATGFFLDHAEHIGLSIEQQVGLNKIKEQALFSKSASDRQIEQAEQELAALTSADQPDLRKIEAKVRDIAKLDTDQRIAFIKAVGEAAKLLTADQRKILTGFASPAPAAAPSPSAAMSPMEHM